MSVAVPTALPLTRQAAILVETTAALTPIDDRTVFLDYTIENLARQGYADILLLAGVAADEVSARYAGRSVRGASLRVLVGKSPIAALAATRAELGDTFLLADGARYFDANLRPLDPLLACHETAMAAIAGPIEAGIGVFRRAILDGLEPSFGSADLVAHLADAHAIVEHAAVGTFINLARPGALALARAALPVVARRPALLLDRDDVLNEDEGYTHKVEDLRWIEGAIDVVRKANDIGALVIVVTNQAGVARGYYELPAVDRFHAAMQRELAQAGAHIDDFYVSPYHPDAVIEQWRHPSHPDRKPNPGMLRRAFADWDIDVASSVMIGDKASDVEAAEAAGVAGLRFRGGDLRDLAMPALDAMAAARSQRLDRASR